MTPHRILLLAGRYGLSGVPLAQLRFARVLAGRGHAVKLVYGMLNEGTDPPRDDDVVIEFLEEPRVSAMLLPLVRLFRSYKPDIVFSAGDHLNAVVLLAAVIARSKAKISCSSRVTPYDTYSDRIASKGWLLKQMTRVMMPRADALTCVSEDMVDQYRTIFRSARHVCVYNIVDGEAPPDSSTGEDEWLPGRGTRSIVAAGALEPWKGFADLIDAMAVVVRAAPARLTILGEGSERAALQRRINELGLSQSVRLRGAVEDPLNYFVKADTFVLSSYVEGMPNVLIEAMLCGCTPVATECPTGPREVLGDGKFGYLVPVGDPAALAAGILASFAKPVPEHHLKEAIRDFQADSVVERHAEVLRVEGL